MASDDVEHQTEVRSGERRWPQWLGLALVVVALSFLVLRGGGGDELAGPEAAADGDDAPPTTPTSETLTTTRPPRVPQVLAITDTGGGPVPVSASSRELVRQPPVESTYEALQATPIATGGRVVVLVDGGRLLAGVPGDVFQPFGPTSPVSEVVASNEPGHVWARVTEDELALVDLDGGEPTVRIPVDDHRILGPASFGVVTVAPDGAVWWRRPSFDATPVFLGDDGTRTPVDAGGELVLVEAPDAGDGLRRFETWSIPERGMRRMFAVDGEDRRGILAPDGRTVALPHRGYWLILDTATGSEVGRLSAYGTEPVWVGEGHFAVAATPHLVDISDSVRHRPPWPVTALAEAAP